MVKISPPTVEGDPPMPISYPPFHPERISSVLPEEAVGVFPFPKVVAIQCSSFLEPTANTPHFTPVTRLKSQHAPKSEVLRTMRLCAEPQKNYSSFLENRYIRMWDDGGRNIKLDQAESTDTGSQSRKKILHLMLLFGALARALTVWLAEPQTKRWPTMSKSEMPNLPWFHAEEGIQRLREIWVLERICHIRPT